jgi:hypothetical protein
MCRINADRIASNRGWSDRSTLTASGANLAPRPATKAAVASAGGTVELQPRNSISRVGKVPHACMQPLSASTPTTPRNSYFFRKNAEKTSEPILPKGFTSIAHFPQKSEKLRKNTHTERFKGVYPSRI